ncbi:ABC transporter ATP-binding protein [Pseudactinotalea sp. HY158]|uniref:ABC transporter ATP-binding protein n=1 Tax=Pseudactinotalea sp. HY158 TaxID=2654547 RepID=UPI0018927C60|nr:ABC transporter ATP-binding protein [Pseudactinotalea sp. HY158]
MVENVSKTYVTKTDRITALDDVSFSIEPGELVSLVGASGCGKSTLLRIIAGLSRASEGSVSVAGTTVTKPNPGSVAVVFQEDALLPWYTIEENVGLGLLARGDRRADIRRAVAMAMDQVGLGQFARAYPRELSGGMRQRAALARGLVMEPEVMLLDEPFAALDEQTRNLMGQELRALHSRIGGTMIMVTHSLTEAVLLSDRVVALSSRPGRVRTVLPIDLPALRPVELIDEPEFGVLRNELWQQLEGDWRRSERS